MAKALYGHGNHGLRTRCSTVVALSAFLPRRMCAMALICMRLVWFPYAW